ncbi:MAG: hypothetical protein K2Q22_12510, partial [Cytophagales bacterium]|nr:hypothetical protein [Cytophagales bacterium]
YDSLYKDTIGIVLPMKVNGKIRNGVKTIIVDDMESSPSNTVFDTSKFDNAYSDVNPQERAVVSFNKQYSKQKVQGSYSYFLEGIDYNFNTYVAGTNTVSLTALAGKVMSTDPNNVYINMYVYGFGTQNTAMNIVLYELDSLTNSKNYLLRYATGYNADGSNYTLDQNKNDVWQILIPVDWTGWKLVSIKYNQFRKHNTLGHLGNNKFEPNKLVGMAAELASSPNMVTTKVSVAFDYVTITEGGPFSTDK